MAGFYGNPDAQELRIPINRADFVRDAPEVIVRKTIDKAVDLMFEQYSEEIVKSFDFEKVLAQAQAIFAAKLAERMYEAFIKKE